MNRASLAERSKIGKTGVPTPCASCHVGVPEWRLEVVEDICAQGHPLPEPGECPFAALALSDPRNPFS